MKIVLQYKFTNVSPDWHDVWLGDFDPNLKTVDDFKSWIEKNATNSLHYRIIERTDNVIHSSH